MKQWFLGIKQAIARFMSGRYGADNLGRFLLLLAYIVLMAGLVAGGVAGTVLYYLGLVCMVFSLWRMLSKRLDARRKENFRYLRVKNAIKAWPRRIRERARQMKTHRFFRCPQCGVTVRVPRGKGKIRIACPRCGNSFVRKS